MLTQLPREISTKALAAYLGITERAVRIRANREAWPRIFKHARGGSCYLYLTAGLPADIRAKLLDAIKSPFTASIRSSVDRARTLHTEESAAARTLTETRAAGLCAFNRLPEQNKKEAEARKEILEARDAFIRASKVRKKIGTALFIREYVAGAIEIPSWIEKALGQKNGKLPLSWATLYRWEKAYTDEGLIGLAARYEATRESGIATHMQAFIKGILTDKPHIGIPTLHQALCARYDGQQIPSRSAVRRFVHHWRHANAGLIQYVTSFDKWRCRHLIALGDADESITRLNQLWEFDSTPGDVMLIDGRHSLIGAIDVFSRRAKLHVTPTSKAAAIAALTRRALLDWGVPEAVKTDNGTDYVSRHLVRVFSELEIEQILCREFHPEDKPHIERFFHTFSHSIVELLPGYIGHSVAERKEIQDRQSFAQRIMKRGIEPVEVRLTAAEFQELIDRWCKAVYNQNPHSGIGGKTPAETARNWMQPIRRIPDERALDILLSPAPDGQGMRMIGKKGIQVENGFYLAPELGAHVGETVFVLLDQIDFGTVYVFRVLSDGSKEFLCRAVDPERTGHDRAEIAAKARAIQERVMREGRAELRKIAKEAAVSEIGKEILAYREKKLSKLCEFPQRSEEYSTDALTEAGRAVEEIRQKELGPSPIPITEEEKQAAAELIDMFEKRRNARPMPVTAQEKYEQLCEDLRRGVDLCDSELAFMKRHELWLSTGERATTY